MPISSSTWLKITRPGSFAALGDLPAQAVGDTGDAGGFLHVGLVEIVSRPVVVGVDASEEENDGNALAGEVVAVGAAIVLVGVEDGLHALGLARGLRGGDERIVMVVPGRRGDPDLFRIVAADHIEVDVGHDPGIGRQAGMVGEPFAARSPFSSPETHRNATLRAGFGPWPNASG